MIKILIFSAFLAVCQSIEINLPIVGGSSAAEITDDTMDLAWDAAEQYNSRSNAFSHFIPTIVMAYERQIVSGTIDKLHVLLQEANCKKNTVSDFGDVRENAACAVKANGQMHVCEMKIWTQVWKNFTEITNNCQQFSPQKFLDSATVKVPRSEVIPKLPTLIEPPSPPAPMAPTPEGQLLKLQIEVLEKEGKLYDRMDVFLNFLEEKSLAEKKAE